MELVLLKENDYHQLPGLIPEEYMAELDSGRFSCLALTDYCDDILYGIGITQASEEGVRIIWLCARREYIGRGFAVNFLRAMTDTLARRGEYLGIYASFPLPEFNNDEEDGSLLAVFRAFEELDFEISVRDGSLLFADCDDVFKSPVRTAKHDDKNCTVLKDARTRQINEMLAKMRADERGVPIPRPFVLSEYDDELSLICSEKDSVVGAFLVSSDDGEDIEIKLVWSVSRLGLMEMMLSCIDRLEKKYPNAKRLFISTVNELSAELVRKVIPTAKREKECFAYLNVNL